MISEESRDTENWSNDAENSALHLQNRKKIILPTRTFEMDNVTVQQTVLVLSFASFLLLPAVLPHHLFYWT